MSKYWSSITRAIEPYVPGEQPKDRNLVKLNTNESPYPPSPRVIEAIKNAANERLRLYPDNNCEQLRETLSQYYGVKKEQVFIGNGSDEVLAFAFPAFLEPGRPILFPDITYSFYPVYSKFFNIDYELIPLDEDFSIPVDGFFKENGGIIISNPNAPTAKCLPLEEIIKILGHNKDSVVIVDEAYIDFGGESAVGLVEKYPNLLVIQTLSKSRCLAGLRVGFAIGHEDLIEGINRIKNSINSYTLDTIALAGANEAIKDDAYFQETRQKIIKTRERVTEELRGMEFKIIESSANFVFISHPIIPAAVLAARLRERSIIVRYFKKPRIDNYLRVSIGSDDEMDCFLKTVKEICANYVN